MLEKDAAKLRKFYLNRNYSILVKSCNIDLDFIPWNYYTRAQTTKGKKYELAICSFDSGVFHVCCALFPCPSCLTNFSFVSTLKYYAVSQVLRLLLTLNLLSGCKIFHAKFKKLIRLNKFNMILS